VLELNGKDLVNIGHPQLLKFGTWYLIQFNRKPDVPISFFAS